MRFHEITEARPSLKRGSFTVQVDPHAIKRAQERNIDPTAVDRLIDNIPGIKAKLLQFSAGEQFYIFSKELNLALGMKMVSPEHRIVRLKTVVAGQPTGVKLPVIGVYLESQ